MRYCRNSLVPGAARGPPFGEEFRYAWYFSTTGLFEEAVNADVDLRSPCNAG
jgi:hypothetical protein